MGYAALLARSAVLSGSPAVLLAKSLRSQHVQRTSRTPHTSPSPHHKRTPTSQPSATLNQSEETPNNSGSARPPSSPPCRPPPWPAPPAHHGTACCGTGGRYRQRVQRIRRGHVAGGQCFQAQEPGARSQEPERPLTIRGKEQPLPGTTPSKTQAPCRRRKATLPAAGPPVPSSHGGVGHARQRASLAPLRRQRLAESLQLAVGAHLRGRARRQRLGARHTLAIA